MFACKATAWNVSKYGDFSGPYFAIFRLNKERYGPEKNCIFGHFSRTELAHDLLIHAVYQKASLFRYLWLHMAIQIFDDLAKIPGTIFFSETPILRSFAKYSWKIFVLSGKRFLHWSPIRMFFSESLFPLIFLELLIMRISHLK